MATDPQTAADIAAIRSIEGIDSVLSLLREVTGLRVALVARVTEDAWTACAVLDEAGFGLRAGDTLDVATTY